VGGVAHRMKRGISSQKRERENCRHPGNIKQGKKSHGSKMPLAKKCDGRANMCPHKLKTQ